MNINKFVIRNMNNVVIKVLNEEELNFVPRVGDILNILIGSKNVSFKVIKVIISVSSSDYINIVVC